MKETIRADQGLSVLMLSRVSHDVELVRTVLSMVHENVVLRVEETLHGAVAALETEHFDLGLLGLDLTDSESLEALLEVRTAVGAVPFVVISDRDDPVITREVIRKGAHGYLAAHEIERFLPRTVYNAIEGARLRREVLVAQQSLEKLVAEAQDAILVLDDSETIRFANPAAKQLFLIRCENLVGESFGYPATSGEVTELDVPFPGGRVRTVEMRVSNTEWRGESAKLIILRDVTERKLAEAALLEAREELEQRVQERTVQLEETNTALNVLLKRREEDRKSTEESIICNVREMILPYLEKLRNTRLDAQQKVIVDILQNNVSEIISPFVRNLFWQFSNLTPTEVQIAVLLQEGRTAKEMAGLLNVSVNTVKFHKANLRNKLGLRNKDVNLRAFLRALKKDV